MNQIGLVGQVVPLLTGTARYGGFLRLSSTPVNVLQFLREKDVHTTLLVYNEIINATRPCPHESRAVRISRVAFKSAVLALSQQVEEVYENVKERRQTVMGHVRGESYTCDLRTLQTSLESQLAIVERRRDLLQQAMTIQQNSCMCLCTSEAREKESESESEDSPDFLHDMVLLE
jgi:hypothetical protein